MRIDWHIHTTLSPCASLEMDPKRILDQARRRNLDAIGITDHNSTRQAKRIKQDFPEAGVFILTGAEVTTREEIHCLAFFDTLDGLDEFQIYLDEHLPDIPNRPELFGDQVAVDANGHIIWEEPRLLVAALDQSLNQVCIRIRELGGLIIPAHVNRQSYSLLSQLGMIPANLDADALEWVGGPGRFHPGLIQSDTHGYPGVCSSDAHHPDEIGIRFTELETDSFSVEALKAGLKKSNCIPCIL